MKKFVMHNIGIFFPIHRCLDNRTDTRARLVCAILLRNPSKNKENMDKEIKELMNCNDNLNKQHICLLHASVVLYKEHILASA
jgi:hypothetical protein